MYNRYIPQPDGSYRKNTVNSKKPLNISENLKKDTPPPPPPAPPPTVIPPNPPKSHGQQRGPTSQPIGDSIPQFLKHLIPGELDTGDLLVIILMLLMAGDCREDRSYALLTLVLYLFL